MTDANRTRRPGRDKREQELRTMWETPKGRTAVLRVIYSFYPDGVPLPDAEGIFSIILNHEYGAGGANC